MSEMVWTKTKPDRPGWWWRKYSASANVLYLTTGFGGKLYPGASCQPIDQMQGEWSSEPIPEPSEPPEHELVQELRTFAAQSIVPTQISRLADKLQAALSGKDA